MLRFIILGLEISVDIPILIVTGIMTSIFLIGRHMLYSEFNINEEFKHNRILMMVPVITNTLLILIVLVFSVSLKVVPS